MPKENLAPSAARLVRRLEALARVSDERGATTRTFLSPAMRRANALVAGWMEGAGFAVREDRVGNLVGRIGSRRRGAKTLLLGSHLDTVRNAGRFDGPLGVLLPIAAAEVLRGRGTQLPFAIEVIGFSEEEGVRFSSGYIGSKGYAGRLGKSDLRLRDAAGSTLGEVLAKENKGRFSLPGAAHSRRELLGYVEVHIEQGPVLEELGLATGVVSAIVGQTRANVSFAGRAGHAGTTPMATSQGCPRRRRRVHPGGGGAREADALAGRDRGPDLRASGRHKRGCRRRGAVARREAPRTTSSGWPPSRSFERRVAPSRRSGASGSRSGSPRTTPP